MMGYNIAFASFHIVEVMSSPDFGSKRIGYLAAAQSFSPTTDVLLLTTNQFKKDLTNGKLQDCSQALTCLAKIITEELGRDLEKDVSLLLSSPRPYIRKKALLVLYRLIMVHPDTLPVVSARFRERLADSDPGVLCAAVTVTTELARAAPSTFLSLAPVLYQLLMNKDSNNWMLIKIVKLMGVLTPLEPRLGKKLVEPLTTIMRTTRAKSLLYECCSTVTAGLLDHPEAVELCAQRLSEFMDESDQNLKYLGLLSMRRLIQAHPHLASEHRDNILDCLDDEDIGIRMRALELVSEFVSKRNLRDISRILLRKLRTACADGFIVSDAVNESIDSTPDSPRSAFSASIDQQAPFREALARQLLHAGEYKRATKFFKGGYEMLSTADDFAWYMTTILGGLSEIALLPSSVRNTIADQLLELTSRVEALRPVSVNIALSLLSLRPRGRKSEVSTDKSVDGIATESVLGDSNISVKRQLKGSSSGAPDGILSSTLAGNTAWILGEYAELIDDYVSVVERLVNFPKRGLDSAAQVRILTACIKVFVRSGDEQAAKVFEIVSKHVKLLVNSQFAEVQDRAWFFNSLLSEFGSERREELAPLFVGKLIPVDPRAQSKVPVADDLDLDTPLLDLKSDSLFTYLKKNMGADEGADEDDDDNEQNLFKEAVFANAALSLNVGQFPSRANDGEGTGVLHDSEADVNEQRGSNPFYLNGSSSGGSGARQALADNDQIEQGSSDHASKYGYESGKLPSEAAVVIAEENPLGLSVSDDDLDDGARSKLESRLQEAFDLSTRDAASASGGGRGGKNDKKKKKKKKKEIKQNSKTEQSSRNDEGSLIDFGGELGSGSDERKGGDAQEQPNYVADTLLM